MKIQKEDIWRPAARFSIMFKINKFGHGLKETPFCFRLITVYETETVGPYNNYLLPDPEIMGCLLYTRLGHGSLFLKDGTKIQLSPNSIVLARHSDISHLHNDEGTWRFHCYWFDFIDIKLPFNAVIPYEEAGGDSFVAQILTLLDKHTSNSVGEANALFSAKVFHLLSLTSSALSVKAKNAKIQPIIDYFRDHIYTNERIDEVAKQFGYCEKQLRNIFRKYIGLSPKQYIIKLKIEKSCELLESSTFSISQISETFSFSSPYHYTNTFKKIKGLSPTAYRKAAQSKNG